MPCRIGSNTHIIQNTNIRVLYKIRLSLIRQRKCRAASRAAGGLLHLLQQRSAPCAVRSGQSRTSIARYARTSDKAHRPGARRARRRTPTSRVTSRPSKAMTTRMASPGLHLMRGPLNLPRPVISEQRLSARRLHPPRHRQCAREGGRCAPAARARGALGSPSRPCL